MYEARTQGSDHLHLEVLLKVGRPISGFFSQASLSEAKRKVPILIGNWSLQRKHVFQGLLSGSVLAFWRKAIRHPIWR